MKPTPVLFALLAAFCLVIGLGLSRQLHRDAYADGYSAVDAGAARDAQPAAAPVEAAPAQPAAAPMPDPIADPAGEASLIAKLWRSGAIPSAVILVAFALLAWARKSLGWLKKGRQAAIAAALFGALAMLAADAADGTTPNLAMLMSALTTGIALYLKSEHQPPAKPAA